MKRSVIYSTTFSSRDLIVVKSVTMSTVEEVLSIDAKNRVTGVEGDLVYYPIKTAEWGYSYPTIVADEEVRLSKLFSQHIVREKLFQKMTRYNLCTKTSPCLKSWTLATSYLPAVCPRLVFPVYKQTLEI